MSDLTVFRFESEEIRVVLLEGETWFVAADIAKVLEHSQTSKLVTVLKDREKGRKQIPTPGGSQEMAIISESGLYRILMRSDKPKAGVFQDWIAEEVLPSIRKTGSYLSKPKTQLEMLLEAVQQQVELERRQQQTEAELSTVKADIKEIQDRATAATAELKSLPPSEKPARCRTTRNNINTRLRAYCHATGLRHGDVWGDLYREFRDRYHIDLKVRAANGKSAPLDIAESLDVIDDLYAIACELFKFEGE